MQTSKIRSLIIASAVFASVASFAGVTAAQADLPQRAVRYSDLDLQSREGQKMLAHRINLAANAVCVPDEIVDRVAVLSCRSNAIHRAYADLQTRGVSKF